MPWVASQVQNTLRRAVNVGVRPEDIVRARQADVKWGLDNLRKVARENKVRLALNLRLL